MNQSGSRKLKKSCYKVKLRKGILMDFSWIKEWGTKSKEFIEMTGAFIIENPEIFVEAIASSIMLYYTTKGLFYSKKLERIREDYCRECNEEYKNQAKDVFEEILDIICNQNLSEEEITELKFILLQNSEWVFA